jgi:hypothetical protein
METIKTRLESELSFLNNTVAAYKDIIDLRRRNLTTIAWNGNRTIF